MKTRLAFPLRVAIGSAIFGAAILAASCGGTSYSSSTSPSPMASSGAPATSTPVISISQNAAAQGGNAFGANPLTVGIGTSVTWINSDSVSHTSTSDIGAWDSGLIRPGGQFTFTLATPGTFPYHCVIHPGMTGSITVQ